MAVGSAKVKETRDLIRGGHGSRSAFRGAKQLRNYRISRERSLKNIYSCMYGVRTLSNAVYFNNCIPPFLFAVYAGVGKLFLAVATSTNGFLRYNSVTMFFLHDFIRKCSFVHYLEISFTDLYPFWRTRSQLIVYAQFNMTQRKC